jgi:hypothetical protein
MKLNLILLLAAGVLTLAGCSSTPTKVNTGAIHARTFAFVNTGNKPAPEFAEKRQPIHNLIQNAITRNLAAKGVTHAASGADLTIGYLIIVGNSGYVTSINDYYGYTDAAADLVDKAHNAYSSSKNPNYFEAGTLVIDVIDTKSYKLLKRGYATRQVLKNLTPDARAERIQEVVDQILSDLRIDKN